ncbi:PAS domain S-box-containing protein [Roseiarcus fermentans]|uniref:histidine kinase n=1 Tax=Roseiarcus fermentans TaxID=1473586 RepID=A0A366FBD1_9HYPH|nr:PAS domain-containing protein [Roseiarcus fermentans]RBP11917.1 PAS domain S-box-containing protein [Roseiarcus fermentans]
MDIDTTFAPPRRGRRAVPSDAIDFNQTIVIFAAAFAFLVAATALAGWLLDVESLRTIWPHGPAFKPNAALALAASAASLTLAVFVPRARGVAACLGLAVATFGCVVLLEYALGADFGFDNLVFQDSGRVFPGRPPIPAAAAFVALGLALALLAAERAWLVLLRGALALAVVVAGFTAVSSFFVSSADPVDNPTLIHVPLAGSAAVVLLGLGVLASSRPNRKVGELVSVVAPILGLAAMALLVAATLFTVDHQRRLREGADDAETAAAALQGVLNLLLEAEAGQRSYLLTGNEASLGPYASAAPKVGSEIARVAALAGASASVEVRDETERIQALAQGELAELRRTIDLKRGGDAAGALAIVESDVGERPMRQLRREVAALQEALTKKADSLDAGADRILARLLYTTLTALSVAAALGGFQAFDTRRRVVGMLRTNLGLAATNKELDRRVADRTRELAAALGSARSELRLRKQAEGALRKSEKQLRLLTEATSSAIYAMGPDWKEMRRLTSDGFLAGVDKSDRGWVDRFVPDSERERVLSAVRTAIETKSVFQLEHRVIREDGGVGWAISSAVPMLDDDGEIVEWFGAATDVTARKQAEEALRASEQRLRRFYDSGLVGVIDWNVKGEIADANDRFLEIVGYTRDDMQSGRIDWRAMTPPEFRGLDQTAVRQLVAGAKAAPFEKEFVRKDGERVPILVAAAMLDERGFDGVAFVLDIAERKRAQAALAESEERLRFALAAARAGVWQWDIANGRLVRTPEAAALLGLGPDELQSSRERWLGIIHPADRDGAAASVQRALQRPEEGYQWDYRVVLPSGEIRWIASIGKVEVSADGAPARMAGIHLDITGRKTAELALRESREALRQSQAHLRHAANSAKLTFADIDLATGEAAVAENFARVMGYQPPRGRDGRSIARAIARLMRCGDRAAALRAVDAVQALLAGGPAATLENAVRGDDGATRWIETVLNVEDGPDRKPARLFMTHRDVTATVENREALARAKAEAERANLAKSKFLASASHDLRQPVQSLVLLMALVEKQVGADEKATYTVAMMKNALGGLNGLLTAILDISRLDAGAIEPSMEIVSLGAMLARLGAEYAPKAAARALGLRVRTREMFVSTDRALFERALRNLIENALRYTTTGGVLVGMRRRGGDVRVDVVDTGLGVPPGKQAEIFEEFRQLHNPGRDLGKGLGLGLAIVARLAPLLGAKVEVSSRPGRGSRFSLTLPLAPDPGTPVVAAEAQAGDAHGAVLIIEDNEILRRSLEAMVSAWGYAAAAAGSGEEALDLGSRGLRLDAIVTDYRLGEGVNGIEAALELERVAGRVLPKLILTGDTAPESLAAIRASGFCCLHKPVAADALRRKLADMLA